MKLYAKGQTKDRCRKNLRRSNFFYLRGGKFSIYVKYYREDLMGDELP